MSQPMEELAVNVLNALKKPNASSEAKIAQLNSLKSSIKHQRIPDSAQAATVECVRLAIASQTSPSLVAAGFSSLTHLVKRLKLQEGLGQVVPQRAGLIEVLLERLGDAKETHRTAASQSFSDIWDCRPAEVEKAIRDGALVSGNARAKLAAMQWVTKMHEDYDLQFRSFVPVIVGHLEDADGTVREGAKINLVDLFRGARDSAKADLKRQLLAHNVRKSITTHILSQIGISLPSESNQNPSTQNPSRSETSHTEHGLPDSTTQEPTLPPSQVVSEIQPLYVYTARDLEDMLRDMAPSFENRESEDNWKSRDNNVLKLRRLLKGNAPTDHHVIFVTGIKSLLDGILKVMHSLRTTLSANGCNLMQELARTLGPAMDPMTEIILHSVDKMCSATKQIAAQNGNLTVDTLLSYVSYNVRYMQYIWTATGDKNVQPRSFACGWLQTVLKRVAHHKSHFEHSGGLELAEKCIKKALSDPNPKVRESMRGTFWVFANSWPEKAEGITNTLDVKSKQLLEQHPGNPNSPSGPSAFSRSMGPELSAKPRLAASSSRASLKEQIAAQKKAAMAKRMPDRPNSAMSSFTPIREAPSSAKRVPSNLTSSSQSSTSHSSVTHSRGPSASSGQSSRQPSSSSNHIQSAGQGSLMSAPVRRPRRPDTARPATADPYANTNQKIATPPTSPKASTLGTHTKSKSTTTAGGPSTGLTQSPRGASPRNSPSKTRQQHPPGTATKIPSPRSNRTIETVISPSSMSEKFRMVISDERNLQSSSVVSRSPAINEDRPDSSHSSAVDAIDVADEDNFTLVIPEKSQIYGARTPLLTEPLENLPSKNEERMEEPLVVYEDPEVDQTEGSTTEPAAKVVLEEVPPSEQNLQTSLPEVVPQLYPSPIEDQERPDSPPKAGTPSSISESSMQQRADASKTRRLLTSGIERIRTRNLDAHGFRRLQDLIKSNATLSNVSFAPLMGPLLDYLMAPNESLKTSTSKAKALKSQALSATRAVLKLCAKDEGVQALVPSALFALIKSTANSDSPASHSFLELEKAIGEVIGEIQTDEDLVAKCVDETASVAELESFARRSTDLKSSDKGQARQIAAALDALSHLAPLERALVTLGSTDGEQRRQRLVALVVRCLGSPEPDVRRKAIELAVALHGAFPNQNAEAAASGDIVKGKEEFWKLMRASGEQQCNLVAYYLARKAKCM